MSDEQMPPRRQHAHHQPRPVEPGPGQESVWDYPRPPALEPCRDRVRVVHAGRTIVDTQRALRVLETSQPPAYYVPPEDVATPWLARSDRRTLCEWKGTATYWSLQLPDPDDRLDPLDPLDPLGRTLVVPDVAWSYEEPTTPYRALAHHLAFYPQRVDECWVGDERVEPNPGSFYGGWITSRIVGPFKGGPGTSTW